MSLREKILSKIRLTPYARYFDPTHERTTDSALALIRAEIKGIENPYSKEDREHGYRFGFERCRQAVLDKLDINEPDTERE